MPQSIRTENYIIRVRPKGVKKLVDELNNQFSKTVKYNNKNYQWSTIIDLKAYELANYLLGKRKTIDFNKPNGQLYRGDNLELRKQILNMNYTEWKKLGFSKGTLHYLKKNAKDDKPFKVYGKVKEKIEKI